MCSVKSIVVCPGHLMIKNQNAFRLNEPGSIGLEIWKCSCSVVCTCRYKTEFLLLMKSKYSSFFIYSLALKVLSMHAAKDFPPEMLNCDKRKLRYLPHVSYNPYTNALLSSISLPKFSHLFCHILSYYFWNIKQ